MELTGGQRKQLREALQAAFLTWEALARMVDEELDVRLNAIARDGPLPEVVYALIQWAQANGRVKELLDKACEANPGNPELAALQKVFNSKGGEKVQPVNHLLDVLSQLLEDPKVREMVFAFRNYFQTARTQIALLGDYKELHDALHDIQMGLYGEIERGIRRFREGAGAALGELGEHRSTLNDTYIKRVRAVADQQSAAVEEANNVLNTLEEASERLRIGIKQTAPKELNSALRCLTLVLTMRPAIIDGALYQASKTLPLRPIADALEVVCQEFERLSLDPEKMGQFSQGIDALHRMDVSLKMMIDAHYKWQNLDIDLRRIEYSLEQDTKDLVEMWPRLKGQAEHLARTNTDGWGAEFLTAATALDAAITTIAALDVAAIKPKDAANVQEPFTRWRRMAARRFYDVDKSLRNQCGLLRTTCEPLDTILGMI